MLEAMAIRLEVIVIRLGAVAIRLEVIAINRLEAMAIRLEVIVIPHISVWGSSFLAAIPPDSARPSVLPSARPSFLPFCYIHNHLVIIVII